MKGILVAIGTFILSTPALADTLSIGRKAPIPTYQNEHVTIRNAIAGAASGMAMGASVGYGMYQMLCNQGVCPSTTRTILPSLLIGTAVGATVGAVVSHILGHEGPFIVYPTVGIGSYGGAPAMMVEGRF
ncbi:MAG: hypothetical protein COV45_00820 [Deltaproteobacteria bacterium CG11_big_fil_rev_8_21_14_0_20_47_16]|nr:MAG: hypothetical protein COV45_00820 [Deltaproteobacteria bacterium CG11_big_fil_rev_8_21_14_0_20_47_16]